MELKARFDEANIRWARRWRSPACTWLRPARPQDRTPSRILVVRREGDGIRHYVHVGTGNYHTNTARLYTDFGLFTCDEEIGADVGDMFNQLTASPRQGATGVPRPGNMRDGILERDRTRRSPPRRARTPASR